MPDTLTRENAGDAMVERVARALDPNCFRRFLDGIPGYEERRLIALDQARAAIAAMREPTEAMLDVLHDRIRILCRPGERSATILNDKQVWAAMIDAALSPTTEGPSA